MTLYTERPELVTNAGERNTYALEHAPVVGVTAFLIINRGGTEETYRLICGLPWKIWIASEWSVTYDGDRTFVIDLTNAQSGYSITLGTIQYTGALPTYGFLEDKSKRTIKKKIIELDCSTNELTIQSGMSRVSIGHLLTLAGFSLNDIDMILCTQVFFSQGYMNNPFPFIAVYCDWANTDLVVYNPSSSIITYVEKIYINLTYI